MLGTRIATAVVLLALLLPALLATQPWPFQALTLVLIAAAGWEWGRLNGTPPMLAIGFGAALALACMAVLVAGWTAPPD
jgi:phosphatidate cytidylyltransferase